MALEPITRQEQIIAGKDLEPITRMERFLKEYSGASSWNDLKDKPFGEEKAFEPIVWDGNVDGADTFAIGDSLYAKISDTILTAEQLQGAKLFSAEGDTWDIRSEDTGLGIVACSATFGTDIMGDVAFSVYDKDALNTQGATIPSNGVYSLFDPSIGSFALSITKETIKPLDEKYLPESVKGGGGKTLVLELDETNNLTANMTITEAVEAICNRKLAAVVIGAPYSQLGGTPMYTSAKAFADVSAGFGVECIFFINSVDEEIFWTANGISDKPPI